MATKAFVLTFCHNVAAILRERGVIVTALCPGPVDTLFNIPEMLSTNAYWTNKPESVVKVGMELFLNGEEIRLVGWKNLLIALLPVLHPVES